MTAANSRSMCARFPIPIVSLIACVVLTPLWGCGTSASAAADPAPLSAEPTPIGPTTPAAPAITSPPASATAPPAVCADLARPGVVRRSAVARVVDAGLGRWLQGVSVDRKLDKGHFVGWLVTRLYPGDPCYGGLELQPGDVVLSINGKSVERPDDAHAVFTALRTASQIVVRYQRGADVRTMTVAIGDE